MKLPKFILWLILFLASCDLYAGSPNTVRQFINHKDWNFVENKGQLPAPNPRQRGTAPNNIVKYYGHQGGVYLYCKPGEISFVFTWVEKENGENISEATGTLSPAGGGRGWGNGGIPKPSKISSNRVDLVLIGSNPNSEIIASDQQEYYENFYLANTPEEGITNVHTFKTITYKNIYPNIDLILHSREEGMKYEFVVYPGGKVSDIQMDWKGIESMKKLKDFGIEYSCDLGSMTESAPFTYQCASNVGAGLAPAQSANISGETGGQLSTRKGCPYSENAETKIESHFVLKNNIIGFKIAAYDKTKPLVIDPTLVWWTYFGGNQGAMGKGVTTDATGNVYITGNTQSSNGIATSGAYQTSYGGGSYDAYLAKFSSSGSLDWATYYGGNADEYANSVSTDGSGNVYITGLTASTSGIATSGTYQTSFAGGGGGGNADVFLAKFSSSGTRLWATYYGASIFSGLIAGGVSTDGSGNVYIIGNTISVSGIATPGAFQTSYGGCFLAKFTSSGTLSWGTYFGGGKTNGDGGHAVSTDGSGNVYITGFTNSSIGIASSGAYQTFYGGGNYDAFLAKFSSDGKRLWATYYGGGDEDVSYCVSTDGSGNVYIAGETYSSNGIATPGAFQTSYKGGGADAFLAKFNSSGALTWATYYGDSVNSQVFGVSTNGSGNVYIAGLTQSTSGIATSGAYQTSRGGNPDCFLAMFSGSGKLPWATYYGGNFEDVAYAVSTDIFGNAYITGVTTSSSRIATAGAYQTVLSGPEDAFLAKFNIKAPIADLSISGFSSPNDSICPEQNDSIIVKLNNYGPDTVNSAYIFWSINGITQDTVLWTGSLPPGNIALVKLSSYHFTSDNLTIIAWAHPNNAVDTISANDTAKMVVHFYKSHFAGSGLNSYTICTGTHVRIGTNGFNGNTYSWTSAPPGFTSTLPNPIVNPDSFTTYYLTETNTRTGCTNSDTSKVNVKVVKAPVANAGKSHAICFGDSTLIGSSPVSGLSYLWSSYPVGFTSVLSEVYVKPIITTIYTVQVTNTTGCTDINNDTITVNHPLAITGPAQSVCSGTVIKLGTSPITGHTYSWTSKPLGFTSTLSDPMDSPNVTKMYYLTEKITASGCSNTDSVLITVMPKPQAKILTDSIDVFTRKFVAINPNYPANRYQWSISDSNTATGYSVIHTFRNGGSYTATLVVSVPGFCTEADTVSINIHPQFSLNIFPNPFFTQTDIRYILVNPAHIKISVVDVIGRNIATLVNGELNPGEYNTTLNATTRPGVYVVIFIMDNNIITRKIVQVGSIFY